MKRITLALLVLISAACTAVVPLQPVKIEGATMMPTLNDGDRVIIDRKFETIERGDIVVFYFPLDDSKKSYIKRIVAVPNDTIEIREGQIVVNGKPLDEPYVDPKYNESQLSMPQVKLTADNYFVVGDNRDNSADSRVWGPLHRRFIYGKYVKKYYAAGS